jgi:uncharacterized protein YndB with AHSA1/START domain
MTVTNVRKDPDARTMTITAEFDAPIDQVWTLWADPRKLERWWGPPTYPATFVDHDLRPGGNMRYYMTGPDGDKPHGWWAVTAVQTPRLIEFDDGFADDSGEPDPAMPVMRMRVTLTEHDAGTRMEITTAFASTADMDKILSMGMEEGMSEAMGQMDELLAGA